MNGATLHIHSARSRLDATFNRMRAIAPDDIELRSDGARYLCVLTSGFLERSVVSLIISYIDDVAHPRAAKLVERKLSRTTNLNAEKLSQLIGSLDSEWEDALRKYLADEKKAAIDSLVALRHEIAHGNPTGVTLATVSDYYGAVKEVVDYLSLVLDPTPVLPAA